MHGQHRFPQVACLGGAKMAKPLSIGDIFQILTSEGICYGQILHKHPKWKYVVGVFYDFPHTTPTDFTDYVSRVPDYITPFLINIAVSRGYFAVIGNVPVASCNAQFPIFKSSNNADKGDAAIWFFWDGEREWRRSGLLSETEKRYPNGPSLPSAPLLIQRIQERYCACLEGN